MHPVASRLDTFQRRSSNSSCEAPAEEKLFCSCSSLSASVALMVQPRVPITAIKTATAADLCCSCVRCVSFQSRARILRFWKKNCRRECDCIRFAKWLRGAARNALAAEGRRSEFFYRRPYIALHPGITTMAADRPSLTGEANIGLRTSSERPDGAPLAADASVVTAVANMPEAAARFARAGPQERS